MDLDIDNPYLLVGLGVPLITAMACLVLKRKKKPSVHVADEPIDEIPKQAKIEKLDEGQIEEKVEKIKSMEELEKQYESLFYGALRIKPANSIVSITAIVFKGSKILLSTSKNDMVMYDLKTWKRENKGSAPEKFFINLGNNSASAVDMGKNYYYACLSFDKTIAIYEFKGGENKTYFKQFKKFNRNILKSSASSLHVSPSEQYLITTGSQNDTVVDVWSMSGQKLASTNSYQIQHYEIGCGRFNILIRGWTSEVKVFSALEEKDGRFKALDKKVHLPNQESPLHAAIDNLDMFAISINKMHKIKLWEIFGTTHKEINSEELNRKNYTKCSLYTFESGFSRYKPLIILGHEKGFTIADYHLKIVKEVSGVEVKDIVVTGTSKRVILGIITPQGQLLLWNLDKQLECLPEISF